ncbi:unnamed protein product [Alopecurus aequalis]
MATVRKNTSSLFFMAALVVVMAAMLFSSCHARRQMDARTAALPVPAPCYSKYFPNCTDEKCKKFCAGNGKPPVSGAFCNDGSNCCCPVS